MAPPPLISKETTVKSETYFVTIDLGGRPAPNPMTGIFVPENYKFSAEVDVILWLMGHHNNPTYPASLTIKEYWTQYSSFHFREFVNIGNKNVILAAPTLGPTSQSGNLTNSSGLSNYLDQVFAALGAYSSFQSIPTLRNLVIACHSGGGSPMLKIAQTTQTYSGNIKQLWGFDCVYGPVESSWVQWAQQNSGKMLLIRYGESTPDRSKTLKRLAAKQSNIDVDGDTGTHHNDVPQTYWNRFMRQATFFADK
jgi:hypothetical protein